MTTLSDFSATAIDGTDTDLAQYDGKVVLVVNTASQCGFTGQYKGLQQLQDSKGGVLGSKIKWNFTKFLVGRDGTVIDRYAPQTEPEKLSDDIEKAL